MDILFVLTVLSGLYMAWNIGANDAANSMATSYGSRALTLKQVIFDRFDHGVLRCVLLRSQSYSHNSEGNRSDRIAGSTSHSYWCFISFALRRLIYHSCYVFPTSGLDFTLHSRCHARIRFGYGFSG